MDKYASVPDVIENRTSKASFEKLRILGAGAFAQCYLLKKKVMEHEFYYAGKIVSKMDINKTAANRRNIVSEISIHRTVNHPNVVEFVEFFEDCNFVYIVLELCERRTLLELHRQRPQLSLEETKYYMHQVLLGLEYLHENNVVHRDIKLSNLLLTHENCVKIADFGLAVRVTNKSDLKHALCGTPNYLAPEVLLKVGHSFGVDIWAFGCVMYTILAGFSPFEGESVPDTFALIKNGLYKDLYEILGKPNICKASAVIKAALQKSPEVRFNVKQLLSMSFFYNPQSGDAPDCASSLLENLITNMSSFELTPAQYRAVVKVKVVWVTAWLDYTEKYGFAYRLSDGTTGVLFNDNTSLLEPLGSGLRYVTSETTDCFNSDLSKKQTLFKYFKSDFDNLTQAGQNLVEHVNDFDMKPPMLTKWARFEHCVFMELQNKSVQVNFLKDHMKILISVKTNTITVLSDSLFHTYGVHELGIYGCEPKFLHILASIYRQLRTTKWN